MYNLEIHMLLSPHTYKNTSGMKTIFIYLGYYFFSTLLEFPYCDEIKVNFEENQTLKCQKDVKDYFFK